MAKIHFMLSICLLGTLQTVKEKLLLRYTKSPPMSVSLPSVPQYFQKEITLNQKTGKLLFLNDFSEFLSDKDWRVRLSQYKQAFGGIILYDDKDLEPITVIGRWYADFMLCPHRLVSVIRIVTRKHFSDDEPWVLNLKHDLRMKVNKPIAHYSMAPDDIQTFDTAVKDLVRSYLVAQG